MKRTALLLFLFLLLAGPAGYPQAARPRGARARYHVTGQYVLRHSNVRGRLDAQLLPGNQVKFSLVALLEPAGGSTRNGVAQGTVPLQGDTAIYRDGECSISMRFLNARVVVVESNVEDCGFGAFVTARGTYVRRSRKPRFDP
jgi:hypothetical protein